MTKFYLQVQKVGNLCTFQLLWNGTQTITAELPYPNEIISLYENWLNIYNQLYSQTLRGKIVDAGVVAKAPPDLRSPLVSAEAKLLCRFNEWLRHEALYDICSILIADNQGDRQTNNRQKNHQQIRYTDIFISCNTAELTRLPWETWEINARLSTTKFRISRQPININQSLEQSQKHPRKARVLAIFGDSTGLDFQKEKAALDAVRGKIFVKQLYWKPGQDIEQFKYDIVNELKSKPGWDILFFAGHSGETELTGGEILIAPNQVIALQEIEAPLKNAIAQGLQFAIFNSCDGLSIAKKLINLGLSQVAIMREKIHNRVAEEIFVQFLTGLSQYQDVHQSLLTACNYLKVDRHFAHPSAYLIPSLFRHPDAELFQLQPLGIGTVIKKWLPKPLELCILGILSTSSILHPVQDNILDWQIGIQAVYRHLTNRTPTADSVPPVLVISVDEKSLKKANIYGSDFNPIPRSYLAQIIDNIAINKGQVIAIDYKLDRKEKQDQILAAKIQEKITQNNTLFIFGTTLSKNNYYQEENLSKTVVDLSQSMQGFVEKYAGHLKLLDQNSDCEETCPFSYLIAVSHSLNQNNSLDKFWQTSKKPNKTSDLRTELFNYINNSQENDDLTQKINQLRLHPLTTFSEYFGQLWLYPIIDYSLPPQQVYQIVSAKDIINPKNQLIDPEQLKQQVILIGAGGYDEAGLGKHHSDNFPIPLGVKYWILNYPSDTDKAVFPGVEINAYMVQHLLKQHKIIPIPDLWMLGIAAFFGKGTQIIIRKQQYKKHHHKRGVNTLLIAVIGTGIYILFSVEMYISANLLFPIFLPSILFFYYILSTLRPENHA